MKIPLLLLPLALLLVPPSPLSAEAGPANPTLRLGAGLSAQYDLQTNASTREQLRVAFASDALDLNLQLQMNNDRKYGSDTIYLSTGNDLGNYLLVDEGDVVVRGLGLEVRAGRFRPVDEITSPYSLVLNPNALAQNGLRFSYTAGPFTYSSEWISLNNQSNFGSVDQTPPAWQYNWNGTGWVHNGTGFPDRGTDVHNFVYRRGAWRFGLQDQSIYSGRAFDGEYFFNPMPQYFTEYLRTMPGRPWTASTQLDKYMMGFFTDWAENGNDAYLQFQMADFNLHFLDPALFPNNPAKFAWSLGGHWNTAWGRWGLFHAGATKYMYESMTVSPGGEAVRDVANFYIPDTVSNLNGTFVPVDLESNEVGYTKGENNLAFLASWEDTFAQHRLHLSSTGEWVIAGANSPANPWHGVLQTPVAELGTQLLNDPVLATTLRAVVRAEVAQDAWTFSARLVLGEAFHVLRLQNPPGYALNPNPPLTLSTLTSLIPTWVPSGENQTLLTFELGVNYAFDATPLLK